MPSPARSAARAGGTPPLSHLVRRVCRLPYTRRPVGDSKAWGGGAASRAPRRARRTADPARMPPDSPRDSRTPAATARPGGAAAGRGSGPDAPARCADALAGFGAEALPVDFTVDADRAAEPDRTDQARDDAVPRLLPPRRRTGSEAYRNTTRGIAAPVPRCKPSGGAERAAVESTAVGRLTPTRSASAWPRSSRPGLRTLRTQRPPRTRPRREAAHHRGISLSPRRGPLAARARAALSVTPSAAAGTRRERRPAAGSGSTASGSRFGAGLDIMTPTPCPAGRVHGLPGAPESPGARSLVPKQLQPKAVSPAPVGHGPARRARVGFMLPVGGARQAVILAPRPRTKDRPHVVRRGDHRCARRQNGSTARQLPRHSRRPRRGRGRRGTPPGPEGATSTNRDVPSVIQRAVRPW